MAYNNRMLEFLLNGQVLSEEETDFADGDGEGPSEGTPQSGDTLQTMESTHREGIEKVDGGYENIGKTGKRHSKKPMTRKKARAQQKAMFYNGFKAKEGSGALPPADNHRASFRPEAPDNNPHLETEADFRGDETPEMGQEHPGNNEFGESLRRQREADAEDADVVDQLKNSKTGEIIEPRGDRMKTTKEMTGVNDHAGNRKNHPYGVFPKGHPQYDDDKHGFHVSDMTAEEYYKSKGISMPSKTSDKSSDKKESLDLNVLIRKMVERGLTDAQIKYVLRTQFGENSQIYQGKAQTRNGGKPRNAYAVGTAEAEKETGDTPPLKKSTITKAHKIAKAIKRKE